MKIQCPTCNQQYDILDTLCNTELQCTSCKTTFIIEGENPAEPSSNSKQETKNEQVELKTSAPNPEGNKIKTKCRFCGYINEVNKSMQGKIIECVKCKGQFFAKELVPFGLEKILLIIGGIMILLAIIAFVNGLNSSTSYVSYDSETVLQGIYTKTKVIENEIIRTEEVLHYISSVILFIGGLLCFSLSRILQYLREIASK